MFNKHPPKNNYSLTYFNQPRNDVLVLLSVGWRFMEDIRPDDRYRFLTWLSFIVFIRLHVIKRLSNYHMSKGHIDSLTQSTTTWLCGENRIR